MAKLWKHTENCRDILWRSIKILVMQVFSKDARQQEVGISFRFYTFIIVIAFSNRAVTLQRGPEWWSVVCDCRYRRHRFCCFSRKPVDRRRILHLPERLWVTHNRLFNTHYFLRLFDFFYIWLLYGVVVEHQIYIQCLIFHYLMYQTLHECHEFSTLKKTLSNCCTCFIIANKVIRGLHLPS